MKMLRKFLPWFLLAGGPWVAYAALASDVYKFTITATNGGSVVSSADVAGGLQYLLQCATGTFRYRTCATSTCTATATDAAIAATGTDFWMPSTHRRVAIYGDGSAGACHGYEVTPPTLPRVPGF